MVKKIILYLFLTFVFSTKNLPIKIYFEVSTSRFKYVFSEEISRHFLSISSLGSKESDDRLAIEEIYEEEIFLDITNLGVPISTAMHLGVLINEVKKANNLLRLTLEDLRSTLKLAKYFECLDEVKALESEIRRRGNFY
ncbi:hypothetical protein KAW80_03945 [Candidatus Babeliales bacterium]|nr:hypothetical protein [Candidatus Babeliales bacterium]